MAPDMLPRHLFSAIERSNQLRFLFFSIIGLSSSSWLERSGLVSGSMARTRMRVPLLEVDIGTTDFTADAPRALEIFLLGTNALEIGAHYHRRTRRRIVVRAFAAVVRHPSGYALVVQSQLLSVWLWASRLVRASLPVQPCRAAAMRFARSIGRARHALAVPVLKHCRSNPCLIEVTKSCRCHRRTMPKSRHATQHTISDW